MARFVVLGRLHVAVANRPVLSPAKNEGLVRHFGVRYGQPESPQIPKTV
ncbi:MAG: hypothetical protein ACI87E_004764 [Mariniblastus sp.]|jgi:hypothetical protein